MTYTTTVLAPCNRGRNARGVCLHKRTKGARVAKKQRTSSIPTYLTSSRLRIDRV